MTLIARIARLFAPANDSGTWRATDQSEEGASRIDAGSHPEIYTEEIPAFMAHHLYGQEHEGLVDDPSAHAPEDFGERQDIAASADD